MTTTPQEPQPDPEVVPSGDPNPIQTDPDVNPPEDPLPEGRVSP
jgi:hypothetical protein